MEHIKYIMEQFKYLVLRYFYIFCLQKLSLMFSFYVKKGVAKVLKFNVIHFSCFEINVTMS